MKRVALIGFVLAALAAAPAAKAHVFLDRAAPAVGSTVHGSPAELELWFSEEVKPASSTIEVFDRHGKRVGKPNARPDASDPALLRLSLPPLPPGTYRVRWRVLSIDDHATSGDFTFEVGP